MGTRRCACEGREGLGPAGRRSIGLAPHRGECAAQQMTASSHRLGWCRSQQSDSGVWRSCASGATTTRCMIAAGWLAGTAARCASVLPDSLVVARWGAARGPAPIVVAPAGATLRLKALGEIQSSAWAKGAIARPPAIRQRYRGLVDYGGCGGVHRRDCLSSVHKQAAAAMCALARAHRCGKLGPSVLGPTGRRQQAKCNLTIYGKLSRRSGAAQPGAGAEDWKVANARRWEK
jgi:hypothetical protein